jgi:Glycosyl transferases group 1
MAKSDLQAGSVYHHLRDSIEAHLTIVFAALAVSRWIEQQTGWSIRKFVNTARRYRTIGIQAGRTPSPPPTPCPPTSGQPSTKFTADQLRTKLSQVRMAAGVPIVASDCRAVRDIVEDGEQGYLVPVGDVDRFTDRLRLLAGDANLRARPGKAGRARAEREFDIERTARAYEDLLAELVVRA